MKKTPEELLHRLSGATHAEIAFLANLGHGNDLSNAETLVSTTLARIVSGRTDRETIVRQLRNVAKEPWTLEEIDRGQRSIVHRLRRSWHHSEAALDDFAKRIGVRDPQALQRHQIVPLPPQHSCASAEARLRNALMKEFHREPIGFPGFAISKTGNQWRPWYLRPAGPADSSLPDWRGYLIPILDEHQRVTQFMRVLPRERKERRYRLTALKGQLPDHPYHLIRDVHRPESQRVERPQVLVIQEKVLGGICFLELFIANGLTLFGDSHPWVFCWMGVDMSTYAAARVVQETDPEKVIVFLDRNGTVPELDRCGRTKTRIAERQYSLILRLHAALDGVGNLENRILVHRWTPAHAEDSLLRLLNGPDDLLKLGLPLTEDSFGPAEEWIETIRSIPELASAVQGDPEILRAAGSKIRFGGVR